MLLFNYILDNKLIQPHLSAHQIQHHRLLHFAALIIVLEPVAKDLVEGHLEREGGQQRVGVHRGGDACDTRAAGSSQRNDWVRGGDRDKVVGGGAQVRLAVQP